jgi:integrase
MAAYDAASKAKLLPVAATRAAPGSIAALVASYYQSADYLQLRPSTRHNYALIIERFREQHGDKPVKLLQPDHIRRMLVARIETPAAANNLRKMIGVLMRHAVDIGLRSDNPVLTVRRIRIESTGFHSWSEDEIAVFEQNYAQGTRERLAFDLLLYTMQRRSDVVLMGPQLVRNRVISLTQVKTRSLVQIPIHPKLQVSLDLAPKDQLVYLTTRLGRGFSPTGFTNYMRAVCDAIGLPICSPHGLRKAGMRRLAEAGCTPHQIMSISGHVSLHDVEGYTRGFSRLQLAESAIASITELPPSPKDRRGPGRRRCSRPRAS